MKRALASLLITAYLGSLSYGIACHTLNFNTASHPGMYFVVWDMFCGWSAYATRTHIVAEGESGRYYQVAPVPWSDFKPYGDLARHNYDPFLNHAGRQAYNCLAKTSHEPIRRMFVIEENWAKKYNLAEAVWSRFFDERPRKHSYFRLRQVLAPCGTPIRRWPSWLGDQSRLVIAAQPIRLPEQDSSFGSLSALHETTRPFDMSAELGISAGPRIRRFAADGSTTLFPAVEPGLVDPVLGQ